MAARAPRFDDEPGAEGIGAADAIEAIRTLATIVRGNAQFLRRRARRGTLDAARLETGLAAIEDASRRLEALAAGMERD